MKKVLCLMMVSCLILCLSGCASKPKSTKEVQDILKEFGYERYEDSKIFENDDDGPYEGRMFYRDFEDGRVTGVFDVSTGYFAQYLYELNMLFVYESCYYDIETKEVFLFDNPEYPEQCTVEMLEKSVEPHKKTFNKLLKDSGIKQQELSDFLKAYYDSVKTSK